MKKNLLLTLLFLSAALLSAQLPQSFRYQAVVRGNDGFPLREKTIGMKISILAGSETGNVLYSESHVLVSNAMGIVNAEIGKGAVLKGNFGEIDWSAGPFYMKTELDVANNGSWKDAGTTQLLPVPFAMYAEKTNTSAKFEVKGRADLPSDTALFEVKDRNGNTVFAVYEGAVRIYVSEGNIKGGRGGFAVGGRTGVKGFDTLMIITPDSIRFYINEESKGGRGGFAVGGRTPEKSVSKEIFKITLDSLRITSPDMKISIPESRMSTSGGFSVGKISTLGKTKEFFSINPKDAAQIVNPSEARVLWYPQKEAFLAGRVLVESPDSVGTNSVSFGYESKAIGNWSQAFGYKSIAKKDYSMAIGWQSKALGLSSYAFGKSAQASGEDGFAFGSGALATGNKSFALGSTGIDTSGVAVGTPTYASGNYSYAIGLSSQATADGSMAIGSIASATGLYSIALGSYASASEKQSMALNGTAAGPYALSIGGYASGYRSSAFGYRTKAIGDYSVAVGSGYSIIKFTMPPTIIDYPTIARGPRSLSIGNSTDARGTYSTAMGYRTVAKAYNSFVIGRYNTITGDSLQWVLTDPLFVIGNGSSASKLHDAFVVSKNGTVTIQTDTAYYSFKIYNTDNDSYTYGIYSIVNGTGGTSHYGVYGSASGATNNYGVYGYAPTSSGFAGYFNGNVQVTGTITQSSDRNLKNNFLPINGFEILQRIEKLPIFQWNYMTDDPSIKHIGPVAQDFHSLFEVGNDDKSVAIIDLTGISLAGIKELIRQNREMREELEQLKQIVNNLKERSEE
ncbi:MAG: hypothetical protein GYA22_04890 [Bacteroidales bacterium]|nr:hypothetical protein [Bacteroidales bacterium]